MTPQRRTRLACLLVALTSALASAAATSQIAPGEIERGHLHTELRGYHTLVLDYRSGNDDAVRGIASWDRKRILRVLAVLDIVNDEIGPWGSNRLKAAAMMHTDGALQLLDQSDTDAALMHLDMASQLLKKAGPEVRGYAGVWYRAMSRLLRSRNSLAVAERLLQTGRDRLPGDAGVLFESGTLQELLAADTVVPITMALTDPRAPVPNFDPDGSTVPLRKEDIDEIRRRRAARLNRAAAWLRESLERDSANMLAWLHLGRVQMLRSQNDDALKFLERATASEDAAVAYLAVLFTGALHERQGRFDAAAAAYRAASERLPANHAAYIALSAVLQRSGHGDEARDVLRRIVDGKESSRQEPWWTYLTASPSISLALVDLLRREARE